MIINNGNGQYDYYCDWCNKYYSVGGVSTWGHNFCSEKCKFAYDKAYGTVDGGYKAGSTDHKIHRTVERVEKIIEKIVLYIFVGSLLLGLLVHLFTK